MRQFSIRRFPLSIGALVLALTSSCTISGRPGNIKEDKQATNSAIEEIHRRFNAREYEKIYREAHASFKASRTESEFCNNLQEVHGTMGEVDSVTDKWINVIIRAPIEIKAVYNTTFTKSEGTEMFVFLKDGNMVRLAGYQISQGTAKPDNPEWHFK